MRSGTLTDEQYARIRAVDKAKKPEQRKEILEKDLEGYQRLFVGGGDKSSVLETAGKHANVIQYVLVLLSDLLEGERSFLNASIYLAIKAVYRSRRRKLLACSLWPTHLTTCHSSQLSNFTYWHADHEHQYL